MTKQVYMSKDEYREHLARLKLTRAKAADILGVCLRSSQAYALGTTRIPKAIAMMLRAMQRKA